jgi:hypothetical protein
VDVIPNWNWLARIYRVWVYRVNGSELVACAAFLTILASTQLWHKPSMVALLTTLLASAALLVLVESAIIYSAFLPMYHSFILLCVVMAPALILQWVGDAIIAWTRNRRCSDPMTL